MKTNKNIVSTQIVKVNNEEITVHRIKLDVNGNPRYIAHFLSLGIKIEDYGKIAGLTKYKAKWFGGGYVFQSYNIQEDIERVMKIVQAYYEKKEMKNAQKYYGYDLHSKGELKKIKSMQRLSNKIVKEAYGNLGSAYLTNGFYGVDCIAIIPNTKEYEHKSGNIVYDEVLKKAVFLLDEREGE